MTHFGSLVSKKSTDLSPVETGQQNAAFPTYPKGGDFFFRTATNELWVFNSVLGQWVTTQLTTTTSTSTSTTTTSTSSSTTTTSTSSSSSTSTSTTTSTTTTL